MFAQSFVLLVVATHALALPTLHGTGDVFLLVRFVAILPLKHKKLFVVANVVCIAVAGGTFTKRKIVDSIQNIGLAHAVVANETIYIGRKMQLCVGKIFVINYGKCF